MDLVQHRICSSLVILLMAMCLATVSFAGTLDEGKALYESGDLESARNTFRAVLEDEPRSADAAYLLGLTYLDADQPKDAIEWFEKAIKLAPEVSRYHQHFGEALGQSISDASMFTKMRKAGAVRKAFQRSVELDPDNLDARRGLVTYYLNAPAIAGGGRDKAEAEATVIADKDALAGHRAWFDIYASAEDYPKAFERLDAIIAIEPGDARAQMMRGILLTEQEEFESASAHFRAWLDRAPDDMQARYQLGRISALSGLRLEEGEAALLAYAEHVPLPREPSVAWANFRLGQIYEHMQRADAARKAYREALERDPRHKQAKAALKALDR